MEKVSSADLKAIVSSLLKQEESKKFNSIVDVGTFLWKVVHKIIDTTKNENLKLQQKEDILVEVSGDVIDFLEENGMMTIELSEKSRNLLKSVDTFLDVLIGLYSFVSVSEVIKNPSRENCIKSIFSILSCFSSKVDSQNTISSKTEHNPKVEVIEETNVSVKALTDKKEDVKIDETLDATSIELKQIKSIVTSSNILNVITEENNTE
jgi:hypothetical protein